MKWLFNLTITLVLLAGCGTTLTGYNFITNAEYSGVKTDMKIKLRADGSVPAGHDLGNGISKGTIIFNHSSDTIWFRAHSTGLMETEFRHEKLDSRNKETFIIILKRYFELAGFKNYKDDELKEMVEVIKAASYGPKGTFVQGQTKYIKVDTVGFDRK